MAHRAGIMYDRCNIAVTAPHRIILAGAPTPISLPRPWLRMPGISRPTAPAKQRGFLRHAAIFSATMPLIEMARHMTFLDEHILDIGDARRSQPHNAFLSHVAA